MPGNKKIIFGKESTRKCLVVSFLIGGFIFFLPTKFFGENREHGVLGAHFGPSFGLFGKRDVDTHFGYDFQLYFSKRIGIQLEYFSEREHPDRWYFGNFIYKFRKIINKKFQPYLSIGYGIDVTVLGEEFDFAAKMGGGVKYRLAERSNPVVINLAPAIFFFIPCEHNRFFGDGHGRHVSFYIGLEIGV